MISLNATIFVQVTLFLILLFVLNRIMIQPLHRLIMEREAFFKEKREELAAVHEDIRRLADDYEARLREAEREARAGQLSVRATAGEEARQLVDRTQEQVAAIHEKVRSEVAQELAKARQVIAEQARLLSGSVAEKVLGRQV
jgi:F-type H+-transporting ATPase subunit b